MNLREHRQALRMRCLISPSWQHGADNCSRFYREENPGSDRKCLSGHDPGHQCPALGASPKTCLLTRTRERFPTSLLSVVLNRGCTFEIPGILFRRLWLGPSQTNQISLWEWTWVKNLALGHAWCSPKSLSLTWNFQENWMVGRGGVKVSGFFFLSASCRSLPFPAHPGTGLQPLS